jgi:hypothetical protein
MSMVSPCRRADRSGFYHSQNCALDGKRRLARQLRRRVLRASDGHNFVPGLQELKPKLNDCNRCSEVSYVAPLSEDIDLK